MKPIIVTICEYPSEAAPGERLRLVLTVRGYEARAVTKSGDTPERRRLHCRDSFDAFPHFELAATTAGGVLFCNFDGDPFPVPQLTVAP